MNTFRTITIPLATLILSILIKYAQVSPQVMQADPFKFLAVEFDLLLISLSILLGAYFKKRQSQDAPAHLFVPLLFTVVILIACFAVDGVSKTTFQFVKNHLLWFEVIAPNFLSTSAVSWSIYSIQTN